MSETDTKNDRLMALDGLRGLAAIAVVFFHYTTNFQEKYGHSSAPSFSFGYGHYGVELFFMISGFVIFLTLDRVGSTSNFAFARFSRLYPAYWVAVLVTWGLVGALGLPGREVSFAAAAVNLTMVHNVFGVPHVDRVYWTLQAELGFYLLAGFAYWAGLRGWAVFLLTALVGLNFAVVALGLPESVPGLWRLYNILPLEYLHLFLLGVVVYELSRSHIPYHQAALVAFVAGAQAAYGRELPHALIVLGLAGVLWLASNRGNSILASRPLVLLGMISYPLYLLHANIGYALMLRLEHHGVSPGVAIAFAVAISIGLATLISHFIEYPAMRKLRAWWQQRPSATVRQRA